MNSGASYRDSDHISPHPLRRNRKNVSFWPLGFQKALQKYENSLKPQNFFQSILYPGYRK